MEPPSPAAATAKMAAAALPAKKRKRAAAASSSSSHSTSLEPGDALAFRDCDATASFAVPYVLKRDTPPAFGVGVGFITLAGERLGDGPTLYVIDRFDTSMRIPQLRPKQLVAYKMVDHGATSVTSASSATASLSASSSATPVADAIQDQEAAGKPAAPPTSEQRPNHYLRTSHYCRSTLQ